MDIRTKENEGLNITIKLDKKHYSKLISEIKKIGKEYEYKSDVKDLGYSILINCQRTPYMKVKGWSSRVIDKSGRISEVIFMDFDNTLFRLVETELKYLIDKYNLTPFYIFTTEEQKDNNGEIYGNYIAICLTKKTFREVIYIQNESHCDQAFKKIPTLYRFKTWCLRIGEKGKKEAPRFKCVVGDMGRPYNQEISNGHLSVLQSLYNLPDVNYLNKDHNSIRNIVFDEYVTAST